MAIARTLKAFLQRSKVKYKTLKHEVAYTAQEIAAAQHVPGQQVAKCVLVKTDAGTYVLAVLPAVVLTDFKSLAKAARAKKVGLASESDIKKAFPDVEVGAMSPFGQLYHVPVIVEQGLTTGEEIVFNAGSHTDMIRMRYKDFAKLAKPKIGRFALPSVKTKSVKPAKPAKRAKKAKR